MPSEASKIVDGLLARVTEDEIKRSAFSIKGNATPGSDGMNGFFFQTYWSVVGDTVVRDVKRFFEDDVFPKNGILHSLF